MKPKQVSYSLVLFILNCLFTEFLFSQTTPLPKQWDVRFGGSGWENTHSVKETTDGGYILGGWTASGKTGDISEASRGGEDYWIVKTDNKGVKQWDRRFGGDRSDLCRIVQQTKDGGYILGGGSYSGISGDKTENKRGGEDYWIVKTDANGMKQWDKCFGGNAEEELVFLQQTTDGGYILGGTSYSGIGGDKTEDSRGGDDFWIVKIDANGNKQWDKRYGGTGEDYLDALQQTSNGGFILAGSSYSGIGGDKTESSRGYADYWIVKTDANGNKQWDKTFGGSNSDLLFSAQQTTDGGYVLGGYSQSGIGGDKTEDNRGPSWTTDYWIIKTDANGTKQWDKCFGGTDNDHLTALQQTADGGYILGGNSQSGIGGDKTEANRAKNNTPDYWIVKTDANGIKQWDKRYGGSYSDYGWAVSQTGDGGYILGGWSNSIISGDKTVDNRGLDDYWIVKLGCPPSAKISGKRDICTTGSVLLKENSTDTLKYVWLKDNLIIPGATYKTYTATTPGTYRVLVYTGIDCRQLSTSITVINSCDSIADNNITITPNPSNGIVTVKYTCKAIANIELRVYDKEGRLMFAKKTQAVPGNNIYQLNLSTLTPGLYNLQLNNGSEKNIAKFAIQK